MQRIILPLVLFFSLVVHLTAKAPDCDQWNTKDYFKTATVDGVRGCLEAGADPMAQDMGNKTPLHLAKQTDNVAVTEILLSKGGPPILSAQDCRMWHTDVFFRTATVQDVKVCLGAGASPKARRTGQRTPLHRAA